jgi:hypothetical protein
MSSIKFTLWIIWIGILLAIGLVILLPLVALLILMIPTIFLGLLIA